MAKTTTWYCPNGHNVFDSTDDAEECGSCGASMTSDPDEYYGVIESIENEGIAKCEAAATTGIDINTLGDIAGRYDISNEAAERIAATVGSQSLFEEVWANTDWWTDENNA